MTPFDEEAIRIGWIPLLHEEPVYFKYQPDSKTFRVVICASKEGGYDIYNKFVKEGKLTTEQLGKQMNFTIKAAFEHYEIEPEALQRGILAALSDYRWHQVLGTLDWQAKKEESKKLDNFIKTLKYAK